MLIWQGKGLLAFIPALFFGIFATLTEAVTTLETTPSWGVGLILGGIAAAALIWWLDRLLERRNPPRTLVDQRTGQQVAVRRRDTFFFIPMRFFPYLYGAAAVGGVVLLATA
ncbi:hypothetical protein K3N28_13145 [Glycomyces sp. TRM65418]|uniref:hypothetical protein n=1 Tax=Glycomyces sp. TRM65418 TaxID=2867006 RepID=UPI001CE581D3|nr:hypothetical protein [Glycomyces sp. TRM65418]MCC3764012.1 hypothetical protein [Glycomyces sp. TRM65418]QZD53705.1 hypothetical protein K3N28_13080 [Glycomyces sp. TRM65418]